MVQLPDSPSTPMAHRGTRRPGLPAVLLLAAMAAVALLAVWRSGFWGPFEPRDMEIAREQYASGNPLRVPTFSGMPFLEKPPLFYDLVALGFTIAGGPSVLAARVVNALLMLVWLASVMLAARRAAGPRAALLAGGLLVTTNLFVALAGRMSVDSALAAATTLALLFLAQATRAASGPIPLRPWLLGLGCAGLAFLSKGLFGSFLVFAPLGAFTLWARDARIARALLRPVSLLVLAAPVLLWAAVLDRAGGATYLFETFVNNTIGRAVSVRFDVAGVGDLPYGDVNSPQVWWYYPSRLGSLAGPAVLLLPFAVAAMLRRGARARGPRARLAGLALCFAIVPLVVLSFSSQKGVHHLGSCTSGFVLAGAVWLDRRMRRRDGGEAPAWMRRAATSVLLLAPLALVAALLGQPATRGAAIALAVAAGLAGLLVALVAVRCGSRALAAHVFLAGAMAVMVVRGSPGLTDEDDLRFLEFPTWLAREAGTQSVALVEGGDSDLGAFCWALRRDLVPLFRAEDARTFFDSPQARLCVTREELTGRLLEDQPGWVVFATGGNGVRSYSVLANAAAAAELPAPRVPPPFARQR